LELALLRQLAHAWESRNHLHFQGRMKPPVLRLVETDAFLGRWIRGHRRLELQRDFVLRESWGRTCGLLLHEMAHQYVHEVLGILDEAAHGARFREICREREIDPRSSGLPAVDQRGEAQSDKVLDRVRKLLALAASADQNEAELAMRRAHELMLRHNVAESQLHARRDEPWEVRTLGDPEKRRTRQELDVGGLLGEYFFVKVLRVGAYVPTTGKTGQVVEVMGTRANVEMAEYAWHFLLGTADRLWKQARKDGRLTDGRQSTIFQSGVISGFRERLQAERAALAGTGLIWVGDRGLEAAFSRRNPAIRMVTRRNQAGAAHAAGREEGRKVVLHKPLARSGTGGGLLTD
jgi:hypothetical protein